MPYKDKISFNLTLDPVKARKVMLFMKFLEDYLLIHKPENTHNVGGKYGFLHFCVDSIIEEYMQPFKAWIEDKSGKKLPPKKKVEIEIGEEKEVGVGSTT